MYMYIIHCTCTNHTCTCTCTCTCTQGFLQDFQHNSQFLKHPVLSPYYSTGYCSCQKWLGVLYMYSVHVNIF